MLLRFLHIDLLGAAGPAARVPSRVGNELEAVLGSTHLNGSAVVVPSLDTSKGDANGGSADGEMVEALVNAGSAVVIIGLMLLVLGVFFIVRRRMGGPAFLLGKSTAGIRSSRREEPSHELDELVDGAEYGGDFEDEEAGRRGAGGEVIFGVGSDDEEEGKKSRR